MCQMALIDFFERAFALDEAEVHGKLAGTWLGQGRAYRGVAHDGVLTGEHLLTRETIEGLDELAIKSKQLEHKEEDWEKIWRNVAERRARRVLKVAFLVAVGMIGYDILRWG